MAGCLRTVSNKIYSVNLIAIPRHPNCMIEIVLPRRSQFSEKLCASRHLSNENIKNSTACISSQHKEHNRGDTVPLFLPKRHNLKYALQNCTHEALANFPSKAEGFETNELISSKQSGKNKTKTIECGKSKAELYICLYHMNNFNLLYKESNERHRNERRQSLVYSVYSSISTNIPPEDEIYNCSSPTSTSGGNATRGDKPSSEQLKIVYDTLADNIPNIFTKIMDYNIYDKQLKFTNNIRGGITTIGLQHYVKQVAMLRLIGHIRFAYIKMNILNMAIRPEDGAIIVRWRISGISGLRVMLQFWKYKLWKLRQMLHESEAWYDGVSTFYVGPDGLIKEHIADKVMPDTNMEIEEKTPLAAKLALLLGLVPRPENIWDIVPLLEAFNNMQNDNVEPLSNKKN